MRWQGAGPRLALWMCVGVAATAGVCALSLRASSVGLPKGGSTATMRTHAGSVGLSPAQLETSARAASHTPPLITAQHVQQSLAKAEPLFGKLRAGMPLSDADILDADVGVVAPVLLARAAHRREVDALAQAYEAAIGGTDLELLMSPVALVSPGHRQLMRAVLQHRADAATTLRSGLHAAAVDARQRLQSALAGAPGMPMGVAMREFDESAGALMSYAADLEMQAHESTEAVGAMLDLLDAQPSGRVIDNGRSFELRFDQSAVTQRYQRCRSVALQALQREQQQGQRFLGRRFMPVPG